MRATFIRAALPCVLFAAPLSAQVTPTGTFTSLPEATFGGTNIPNSHVMVSATLQGLIIGLSASAVPGNLAVTNNGAGTFYAQGGADISSPSPSNPFARWMFNWYVNGEYASSYNYRLFYDFNPAAGTTLSDHGRYEFTPMGNEPSFPVEFSWNLGYGFLTSFPGFVTPPAYGPFDPNMNGEYTFALAAYTKAGLYGEGYGAEVDRVAIAVSTVPEPGTWLLLTVGLGALCLIVLRRNRKRQQHDRASSDRTPFSYRVSL